MLHKMKALQTAALAVLMLTTSQAYAEYQCSVKPQDDVIISPQSVQVVGASGHLQISPDGDVIRNGQTLTLTDAQRQQAFRYQTTLRQDVPWIEKGTLQHLEKARVSLDKVIVKELGSNSNMRNRLTTLNDQLKQQIGRIIEKRSDGLAFHHQAVDQVEKDGRQLLQQSMGGILQDSLNEMGVKLATSGNAGSNPLQAIIGNLGGLQQSIQDEWSNKEQEFQQFGHQVCQRVTSLEQQHKDLLNALN